MEHSTEGPSLVLPERGDIIHTIRNSPDFVRLWVAQMISMGGDWFITVPLMTLVKELTGSHVYTGLVLICNTLPTFLVTPLAGVLADRFNRKTIIIVCNFISAVTVLGLLLLDRPDRVWICYACTIVMVTMGACILPAATAGIPAMVGRENLGGANALFGITWGLMLAIGSAAGGFVAGRFGRPIAFEVDSAALLLASLLVFSIKQPDFRVPEPPPLTDEAPDDITFLGAVAHLRQNPHLALVVLSKAFWGLGGGMILLLTIFPMDVYHAASADADTAVGLLYSMRGVGTLLGPLLALMLVRNRTSAMARAIGTNLFLCGVCYALFSQSPTLGLAAFFVLLANMATAAVWVVSTTMMQLSVPNVMMGRLSAIDLGSATLTMAVSLFLCSWYTEGSDPERVALMSRLAGMVMGVVAMATGLLWGLVWHTTRRRRPPLVAQHTLAEVKAMARAAGTSSAVRGPLGEPQATASE